MQQIVINQCPSGTLFSEVGKAEYLKRKSLETADWEAIDRADPVLVQMMRDDLTKRVWAGSCSHIAIVEIPDDMEWKVERRGNYEWVAAVG